jgi:hypothetical protein
MPTIHERYGVLQERYECECEEHLRTIGLVRDIVEGRLPADRVRLLPGNRWEILPPPTPEEPH